MNVESVPGKNKSKTPPIFLSFPETGWRRLVYGLFAFLLPGLFLVFFKETRFPVIRSASLYEYIFELLFPKSVILFFLLVAYSTLCYVILLYAPKLSSQNYFSRFGIYTGILLTAHYGALLGLALIGDSDLSFGFKLSWLFFVVFPILYRWIVKKWHTKVVNMVFVVLIMTVYFIFSLSTEDWLFSPIAAVIIAAPFWSALLYFRTAVWLINNHETKFNLSRGLGALVWIAIYVIALRFDIL